VRRALMPERHLILPWIGEHFSAGWADECEAAFARQPLACFLALKGGQLCGFSAYEATCRNFLGPLGVLPHFSGKQLGRALLLASLHAMQAEGYAYAIIGGAGPLEFFQKASGAVEIAGSSPGIYRGMLRSSSHV
jgi:GNAT superfamily N-acetyltransferase